MPVWWILAGGIPSRTTRPAPITRFLREFPTGIQYLLCWCAMLCRAIVLLGARTTEQDSNCRFHALNLEPRIATPVEHSKQRKHKMAVLRQLVSSGPVKCNLEMAEVSLRHGRIARENLASRASNFYSRLAIAYRFAPRECRRRCPSSTEE